MSFLKNEKNERNYAITSSLFPYTYTFAYAISTTIYAGKKTAAREQKYTPQKLVNGVTLKVPS